MIVIKKCEYCNIDVFQGFFRGEIKTLQAVNNGQRFIFTLHSCISETTPQDLNTSEVTE